MCRTTAECPRCKNLFPVDLMVRTESRKRGCRPILMCADCASHNSSYHTNNDVIMGTAKANAVKVGIEFETSFSDEYSRAMMFEYGFIPTHDGSLDSDGHSNRYGWDENTCEYVSGIMQGLNRASKFALSCDYMMSNGHLKVNNSCGTHFHVSVNDMRDAMGNKTYMGYIRRFYNSLFVPLCEEMKAHPVETTELFGRNFTRWAKEINWESTQSRHDDRYHFINCLAENNIEFRLNKFVNGKQYQKLMKMEVEMVKCIVANFCDHFMDTEWDRTRYEKRTHYRKHKADMTAKKLVKIYRKYANL